MVPEAGIHDFEAIRIDEEHGKVRIRVTVAARDRVCEQFAKESTVGQTRQRVVGCIVNQIVSGACATTRLNCVPT